MLSFQGYLANHLESGTKVVARFVSGDMNPSPVELPVLKVEVSPEGGAIEVLQTLSRLKDEEAWLYISHRPGEPLQIESEYGDEYFINGSGLIVQHLPYEAEDFQRLAHQNHARAIKLAEEVRAYGARIARLQELLSGQRTRVSVKAAGHPAGTTARTLYEQHLSFLERLRGETEA